MLEVGNGDLTPQETRTHFALWAIMKSPLIIGTDLAKLSQANVDILQNKLLLAFNQDNVVGKSASPYKWGVNPDWTYNATNPAEFWAGRSSNGTIVAMINTLGESRNMRADLAGFRVSREERGTGLSMCGLGRAWDVLRAALQ